MQIAISRSPGFTELDALARTAAFGVRSRPATDLGRAERPAEPSLLPPAMSSAAGRGTRRGERAEWRCSGDAILDHTGRS
jgi:hypothetical protein